MARPSIAYVDEQKDERDNFFNDAYDSDLFGEIYLIEPNPDINDTLAELLGLKIEALVTDFNFSGGPPIGYSGEDLAKKFLSVRKEFPCFIRTSWEEEAFNAASDVNRVYSKDISKDKIIGRILFDRIVLQIESYKRQIENWTSKLDKLMAIAPSDRNAADIELIIELDGKLESSIGADLGLPGETKKSLFDVRDSLLEETERLVAEMKKALGEELADEQKPAGGGK